MLFALLGLCAGATRANAANFDSVIKKGQVSIVVFEEIAGKCKECPHIVSMVDKATKAHGKAVTAIRIDRDEAPAIANRYNISFVPQVALFRHGELRMFYTGDFTEPSIRNFITNVVTAKVRQLNNTFDVFEFQNMKPLNLLLAGTDSHDKAQRLLTKYGGAIEIGVVEDPEVIRELELAPATLTRPDEQFKQSFQALDDTTINDNLFTPFIFVNNSAIFGWSKHRVVLTALLDTRDPLQLRQMMEQFREAHKEIGDEIGYQYCDFFVCKRFADAVGLDQVTNPFYILNRWQAPRPLKPLKKWIRKPNDVAVWLKEELYGEKPQTEDVENGIEKVRAADFAQKVLDPNVDVILFVASPDMEGYPVAVANAQMLVKLFADIPSIKLYELNQHQEYIEGLQIPGDNKPVFSIWKASNEPSGSAFSAELQIPVILDAILQLVATQISDAQLEKMVEMVQEMLTQNGAM